MPSTRKTPLDTMKEAISYVGPARWGLVVFTICLATSTILSITCITNAMSGHDQIMNDLVLNFPYPMIVLPILIVFFCMAFSASMQSLDANARKTAIYIFVGIAYIFSMLTLHLSTFVVTASL